MKLCSPSAWRTVRFGDVVHNVREVERDPLAAGIERYVGLEHMEPENLHVKSWGLVAEGTTFTQRFRRGQVLFGKRRAYQRKVAVAEFDGVCSGDILVFEPKDERLLPELLPFIVQSEGFFANALRTSSGSLSPRTRWRDLAAYEFPLPSLDEQRRIADILWAADELVQLHTKVLQNLDQLKGSAIIALLGIEDPTVRSEIVRGKRQKTATGWPVYDVVSLAKPNRKCVQVGPFGSAVSSLYFTDSGTAVLKINNITDDGRLDLSDLIFISDQYATSLSQYAVESGDLVTAAQATTGRSALISPECGNAIISQHLIRVAVDENLCIPEYLLACFLSPLILQQIAVVKQKTTRDGLNTEDVENFRIPLPPLEDQQRIVQALNSIIRSREHLLNHLSSTKAVYRALLTDLLDSCHDY